MPVGAPPLSHHDCSHPSPQPSSRKWFPSYWRTKTAPPITTPPDCACKCGCGAIARALTVMWSARGVDVHSYAPGASRVFSYSAHPVKGGGALRPASSTQPINPLHAAVYLANTRVGQAAAAADEPPVMDAPAVAHSVVSQPSFSSFAASEPATEGGAEHATPRPAASPMRGASTPTVRAAMARQSFTPRTRAIVDELAAMNDAGVDPSRARELTNELNTIAQRLWVPPPDRTESLPSDQSSRAKSPPQLSPPPSPPREPPRNRSSGRSSPDSSQGPVERSLRREQVLNALSSPPTARSKIDTALDPSTVKSPLEVRRCHCATLWLPHALRSRTHLWEELTSVVATPPTVNADPVGGCPNAASGTAVQVSAYARAHGHLLAEGQRQCPCGAGCGRRDHQRRRASHSPTILAHRACCRLRRQCRRCSTVAAGATGSVQVRSCGAWPRCRLPD